MSCEPDLESVSKEWISLTQRHSEAGPQRGEAIGSFPKCCQHIKLKSEKVGHCTMEHAAYFYLQDCIIPRRGMCIEDTHLSFFFKCVKLLILAGEVPFFFLALHMVVRGQRSPTGVQCLAEDPHGGMFADTAA